MKKINWEKKGQIFNPAGCGNGIYSHGQVPYYFNTGYREKIYFTARPPADKDGNYVSNIHAVNVTTENGDIVLYDAPSMPLLAPGDMGCFDEYGTMPCSIIQHPGRNEVWMYYVGWARRSSVPYDMAIGLAISKDGGETFEKYAKGPLMGADEHDPFLLSCPRVYIFNGKWYMFYLAGIAWSEHNGKKEPFYKLKIATSDDGIHWQRNNRYVITEVYKDECQTCSTVFELNGLYHMYFTYRHAIDFRNPERGYRIGYASSTDLVHWTRNDEVGNFHPSPAGWDAEMVCYPNINKIGNNVFMLYCGNSFGSAGFGYAVMK